MNKNTFLVIGIYAALFVNSPAADGGDAVSNNGPRTAFHYTSGGVVDGRDEAAAAGFNLADVSSAEALAALPKGSWGLVWLGMDDGATDAFKKAVQPFIGKPNLYGFFLVDEPDPTGKYHPLVTAAHLKEESDWIHAHVPGAKTFIVLMNMGSNTKPAYDGTFNSANTGIDLFGIDPYPCQASLGGCDFSIIKAHVNAAIAWGITQNQIVPVYQAFGGGYPNYLVPTPAQAKEMLAIWGSLVPAPAFDFAYSWGSQHGDSSLSSLADLREVFAAHNK